MQFLIHTDDDKDITFSSKKTSTIKQLKSDITSLYKYENFDLYLFNDILHEDKTLGECGIKDFERVNLIRRQ